MVRLTDVAVLGKQEEKDWRFLPQSHSVTAFTTRMPFFAIQPEQIYLSEF
jgi:hypothetical protein